MKQVGPLRGISNARTRVHGHAARLGCKPTSESFQQRALAAAAGTDHRNTLPGLQRQRKLLDHHLRRAGRTQRQSTCLQQGRMRVCRLQGTCGWRTGVCNSRRLETLQQPLGLGHCSQGVCAVMVMRGQAPQGREEFRRQQKAEHARAQRRHTVQMEHAQITQTEVQRHDRHADGGKKFQHGRRQECDAQHFQRALAHALGSGGNALQLSLAAAIHAQQSQALEAIGKMPTHARQLAELFAPCGLGAPPHQHHEERNQRRSKQQHQPDHPIDRKHRDQDQRRHQQHFDARELVADEIAFQCIGMRQAQFAQFAAALPAQP